MNKLIEKIKKHSFTFMNYNYMGLYNCYENEPIDTIDECCRTHDLFYDRIIQSTDSCYPYVHYNFADEELLNDVKALDTTNFSVIQFEAIELIIAFLKFKHLVCEADLRNY